MLTRHGLLVAVVAMLAAMLVLPAPTQAAPAWEVNYATKIEPLTYLCSTTLTASYGGLGIDPYYEACVRIQGDILRVRDNRADGYAGVMKWQFFPPKNVGRGYETSPSRQGICIYTGGSSAANNVGICNKDFPEVGLIKFWAGKRLVSGSTSLTDMRFGSSVCLGTNGSSAIGDPFCALLALS